MRMIVAMVCLAGPVWAADGVVGRWQCATAFAEYDADGAERVAGTMDYALAVMEGGRFRAEGVQSGPGGGASFQALGRWDLTGDAFTARGQASFGTFGQGLFGMAAALSEGGGEMRSALESRRSDGAGPLSRTQTVCTRAG